MAATSLAVPLADNLIKLSLFLASSFRLERNFSSFFLGALKQNIMKPFMVSLGNSRYEH
jgi:hypothetical protein